MLYRDVFNWFLFYFGDYTVIWCSITPNMTIMQVVKPYEIITVYKKISPTKTPQ